MAGFLYAIRRSDDAPKDVSSSIVSDTLTECGLEHLLDTQFTLCNLRVFDETCWLFMSCGYGPNATKSRPLVTLNKQTWRTFSKFHIGMNNEKMPQPNDLARRQQYFSQSLVLGDGQSWRIPVIPIDSTGLLHDDDLPREFDVDEGGSPKMRVCDFYAPLEHLVRKYWDYKKIVEPVSQDLTSLFELEQSLKNSYKLEEDETKKEQIAAQIVANGRELDRIATIINSSSLSDGTRALDCVTVLSRNYHIGPIEVAMLRLLNTATISRIILYAFLDKAAIDLQVVAEKKG